MKLTKSFVAATLAALALPALATKHESLADAEVRKVDKEAKKVTLRHGPIPSLDMAPMTMVFRVKDPAMLETLKQGDKVRFAAEKVDGNLTVTRIEPAKK